MSVINWIRRKLDWPPYRMTGVVERCDLTFGGPGNQWTFIDGVRYATYWNVHTKDWTFGDRVTFDVCNAPIGMRHCFAEDTCFAENIRKEPTP